MSFLVSLLVFILGLVFGSFAGVLVYRIPKNKNFSKGRSYCDNCKQEIAWYDNIPLFSFILLKGKCRNCGTKINFNYPLIEFLMGTIFLAIYLAPNYCSTFLKFETICSYSQMLGFFYLPITAFFSFILLTIFFIDLETFLIPDSLVYSGYLVLLIASFLTNRNLFEVFYAGLIPALILLSINIITKGRGMGLGDVKLAVFVGGIFGIFKALEWLFVGFLTGGFVGIILILVKKARLKQEIPFGPFLVAAFFVVFFAGQKLMTIIR